MIDELLGVQLVLTRTGLGDYQLSGFLRSEARGQSLVGPFSGGQRERFVSPTVCRRCRKLHVGPRCRLSLCPTWSSIALNGLERLIEGL